MFIVNLFYRIPLAVWKWVFGLIVFKYILNLLTGINIIYFNPLKCKFGFRYKDQWEISNIQIMPLQRKIVISGLKCFELPSKLKPNVDKSNDDVKNTNDKKNTDAKNVSNSDQKKDIDNDSSTHSDDTLASSSSGSTDDDDTDTAEELHEVKSASTTEKLGSLLDKWFNVLIFLFDDFRIALNHIELKEFDFKLDVLYLVLKLENTNDEHFITTDLMLRHANWNGTDILSDLYWVNKFKFQDDRIEKIVTDLKLGKIVMPMKSIERLKKTYSNPMNKIVDENSNEPLTIDQTVQNLINKFNNISNDMNKLQELNVTMESFQIKDYSITMISELQEVNQYLSFCITTNNFTFNLSRFKSTMPGYQLTFTENDSPLKASLTMSRFSVCLNIKRKDEERKLIKYLDIPNISLFGESNLLSQPFEHTYGKTIENCVINVKGNISSPTFEIDIMDWSFFRAFLANIKVFKTTFGLYKAKQGNFADDCSLNPKAVLLEYFKSFLPFVNAKVTVDEPRMIMRYKDNLIISKLCTLLIIGHSKRFQKENEESHKEESWYQSVINLELLDFQLKHVEKKVNYSHTFFSLGKATLQDIVKMIPKTMVSLSGSIESFTIDLSELPTMVMLNEVVRGLDCQMCVVEKDYFRPFYEKFASMVKQCRAQCSRICESKTQPIILPSTFLFQPLPEFFDYFKVDITDFDIVLGARSVFMPPEIFSSVVAQSSHDLVDNQLRKFSIKMNQLQIALSGNYTQWRNKYDDTFIGMQKAAETSLYRSYNEDGGLDDISTSESTEVGYIWSFAILIDDVTCSVIGEAPDATNVLTKRTFSKMKVLSINIFPETEGFEAQASKKIVVQIDNKKLKVVFSLMNMFLVISGAHTLNQIFRKSCKSDSNDSWAKQYLIDLAKTKRKSFFQLVIWKEIISYLDIRFSSDLFHQVLPLPNGLNSKIEAFNIFADVSNLQNINVSGDALRVCIESPTRKSYWERFVVINQFKIETDILKLKEQKNMNYMQSLEAPPVIFLENESWHLSIPYKFELHKLIDNFSTVFKTIKQMTYSFKTSKNDLIIFPHAVKSAAIPKIKLKSKRYILSIDDDPFEAEMNMIFQLGLLEQKARLVKLHEFDSISMERLQKNNDLIMNKDDKVSEVINSQKLHPDVKTLNKVSKKAALVATPFNIDGKSNKKVSLIDAISEETKSRYNKLQENFSTSWIRRVQTLREKQAKQFNENFSFIWGNFDYGSLPRNIHEKVRSFKTYPFLSSLIMEGIDVDLCRPSSDIDHLPDFIHRVGKGVPKDTKYSIMIPLHIDARFSEVRWHMRDYPLPFINVPPLDATQTKEAAALHIYGDLVACEDMVKSDHEFRVVFVPLVPSIVLENTDPYYSLKVPRTITAIKFYNDLKFDVYSKDTCQIHIGSSYQPAIQQTMQCLENISKPPLDPSQKTGFWDKVRYLFHGYIKISWPRNGKFEVAMKGSKSPYAIGNENAGFVLGFGGDVVLNVNENDDPKKFLSCTSDTIYFSIPNYFSKPLYVWSKPSSKSIFIPTHENSNLQQFASYYYLMKLESKKDKERHMTAMNASQFEKTPVKLSGGVTLNMGLVFERIITGKTMNERTFNSIEHYKVRLSNPIYIPDLDNHDSYAGFRSEFMHMSLTIISKNKDAYNCLQLSPGSLAIFFKWWKTFSGNFPVRRGKLFNIQSNAPKFGEHLTTISYHADASPLFISHIVHENDSTSDAIKNFVEHVEFVGVKGRVDNFSLDLHQRKELLTQYNSILNIRKRVKKMKFLEGLAHLSKIDIRTISAQFTRLDYVEEREDAKYDICDNDMSWLDLADFEEVFFINTDNFLPHVCMRPLLYAPEFIYEKIASYHNKYQLDSKTYQPIKPFENTVSHDCVLHDKFNIPTDLITERINTLTEYRAKLDRKSAKSSDPHEMERNRKLIDEIKINLDTLDLLADDFSALRYEHDISTKEIRTYNVATMNIIDRCGTSRKPFENRYLIFHMLLKWNEELRNVILKYVYYLQLSSTFSSLSSQKTIRMIEELIDYNEQRDKSYKSRANSNNMDNNTSRPKNNDNFEIEFDENVTTMTDKCIKLFEQKMISLNEDLPNILHSNNFIHFMLPQFQITTKEEPDMTILVTTPNIMMKTISFEMKSENDNIYLEDVFLERTGIVVNNANAYLFNHKDFTSNYELYFDKEVYSPMTRFRDDIDQFNGKCGIIDKNNNIFPPWLGIESIFRNKSIKSYNIVEDISIVMHKQNVVPFSSYYDEVKDKFDDKMTLQVPKIEITLNSKKFKLVYDIINNLIIYRERQEVELQKRIDKMRMRYDYSMLNDVRDEMKQLYEGHKILCAIEKELTFKRRILNNDELSTLAEIYMERQSILLNMYMNMEMIKTNSVLGRLNSIENEGRLKLMRIKVNLINLTMLNDDADGTVFLNVCLNKLFYQKGSNINGQEENKVLINMMTIENMDDDTIYKQMLGPYQRIEHCKDLMLFNGKNNKNQSVGDIDNPLIQISWSQETPVGGIKIVNNIEVIFNGLDIQVEDWRITKILHWLNLSSLRREIPEGIDEDGDADEEDENDMVLNEMMERSNQYMIIEHMKIHAFELNVSYKGHGKKRLINVSNLRVQFPEYVLLQETIRLMDLLKMLKRLVIRILLKHTGKFLSNKISSPRRSKTLPALPETHTNGGTY